jgi:hypothetical protein
MAYELLTVLLGGCAGAAMMIYLASRGNTDQVKSPSAAYAPTPEPAPMVAMEAPAAIAEAPSAEPSPTPAPAAGLYETVQPSPSPVTYAAPSTTSFGAPTLAKKPTRTYRRRTAPVRGAAGSKKTLAAKQKKR